MPWDGRLAQLEERLVYTEDVGGSSPSSPTSSIGSALEFLGAELYPNKHRVA